MTSAGQRIYAGPIERAEPRQQRRYYATLMQRHSKEPPEVLELLRISEERALHQFYLRELLAITTQPANVAA